MTPFLQLPVSRREEREPRPELRCEGDPRGPHQGDAGAVRALLRDGLHVSGEETVIRVWSYVVLSRFLRSCDSRFLRFLSLH